MDARSPFARIVQHVPARVCNVKELVSYEHAVSGIPLAWRGALDDLFRNNAGEFRIETKENYTLWRASVLHRNQRSGVKVQTVNGL